MLNYNIDASNYFYSRLQDKYDVKIYKCLETKAFCQVLINTIDIFDHTSIEKKCSKIIRV